MPSDLGRRVVGLVVDGDGIWALRLRLGSRTLLGLAIAVTLAGLALGAAYRDYLSLREHRAQLESYQSRLAEQQALIETFQGRLAQVRTEVSGWRQLYEKMWEPFGPEAAPGPRGTGVGGGTALRHVQPPSVRAPLLEELDRLASAVAEQGESLRELDRFLSKAGRILATLPFRWPLRGAVNSEFGTRPSPWGSTAEFHSGLDIKAKVGTPITAPASGTVVFAGRHAEYGITLIIDHGNDIKSLYGHLSRVSAAQGQRVDRGQVVALSGNTGRSSGPHLHYEIQVRGEPVNPRRYLWD